MANVIVIMADQLKATALDMYWEDGCKTPNISALANRGTTFVNAFTPHPLCVPARVSLWTSQYPHTHGARRNETLMPEDANHAFDIWSSRGYTLGLIGKNHCFGVEGDLEKFDVLCTISHRGFPAGGKTRGMKWVRPADAVDAAHWRRNNMVWDNPWVSTAISDYPAEDTSTGLVAAQTSAFIDANSDKPFALWVSFPDPHEPYECLQTYYDRLADEDVVLPPWHSLDNGDLPERNRVLSQMLGIPADQTDLLRKAVRIYYAAILHIDDAVGQIMTSLRENGIEDDTIVVFCSDHGDFMGEHGMTCKGGVFYDCLTRVPLLISWPGKLPEGSTDDSMVSLIDIVPTLLTLQDIQIPESMQGLPLPTITKSPPRDEVFSEYGAGGPLFTEKDMDAAPRPFGYRTIIQSLRWREAAGRRKMVRTKEWKYVHDPCGDMDELYDLVHDQWETTNLSNSEDHRGQVNKMRERLMNWSIRMEDPVPVPLPKPQLRI